MISSLLLNNLLGCLGSKESRPKLGKGHSKSTVLQRLPKFENQKLESFSQTTKILQRPYKKLRLILNRDNPRCSLILKFYELFSN